MTDFQTLTLDSLRDIGLGPQRVQRASENETLYGSGGLLNSIELVQFVAALSERTGIEIFELMDHFQGEDSIFNSLSSILAFLEGRNTQQMMAG